MALKPIEILIKARDEASGIFGTLQGKVAAVGAAIAGYFSITTFVGAVKGAADLEAKLSEVKAVSNATAEEMKELRKAAEDAGASTRFTATEGAEALGNLTRAGLSAKDAIAALPAVLSLAQAGGIGLGEASDYVTKAVQGMGLQFSEAGRVADVLAMGANASNASVTGLAQALSYAAPVANSLGLSLETTVAIIGKFSDAGIDASRAGTALNAILSQFSDPASKFQQELANLGIVTNDFEVALRKLAAAGPAGKQAILAVGTEAGPALRALLNQGIGALDDLKGKLHDAAGSAAATAAVMEDNLHGAFNGLASAWDTVKNALATPVLPVLKDGVTQLANSLRGAVTDGTIGKFGDAIATAFQSGIAWAKQFVGAVDFTALTEKMQAWADSASESFAKLGQSAATAGSAMQLIYGVMAGGVNSVMVVVYKLAEAFSGVASNIQSGLAMILTGLSKVTFGALSKSFKEAAEEVRISAGATMAVSQAFAAKAAQAFDAAAEGARITRSGFKGLSDAMAASDAQSVTSERVIRGVADALKQTGTEADQAAKKAKTGADAQKEAADRTRAAVAELRKEYEAAVAAGDWQLAAQKMQAIQRAYQDTRGEVVKTREAIEAAGKAQQASFDLRQSAIKVAIEEQRAIREVALALGNESAAIEAQREIRRLEIEQLRLTGEAKRAEAKAAIAVAEALRAELSARGDLTPVRSLEIEASIAAAKAKENEARIAELTAEKLSTLANISDQSGQAAAKSRAGYDLAAAGLDKMAAASERAAAAERKRLNVDKEGFTLDKNGNRLTMGGQLDIPDGYYFDAEAANKDPRFTSGQSNGSEYIKPTQDTLKRQEEEAAADLAARRTYLASQGLPATNGAAGTSVFGRREASASTTPAPAPSPTPLPAPAPSPATGSPELIQLIAQLRALTAALSGSGRTVDLNLTLNGVGYGSVATNEAGAQSIQTFIAALQTAQRAAA